MTAKLALRARSYYAMRAVAAALQHLKLLQQLFLQCLLPGYGGDDVTVV
jgi:hypothetical protein